MAKTITFNADERQRALVVALAKRLGFRNHSDMLRTWLEGSIAENIPPDEQAQIVALYSPRAQLLQGHAPPQPAADPKARRTRQPRDQAA